MMKLSPFVINIYNSISRENLENYLHKSTYILLIDVVREVAKGKSLGAAEIEFIANFYKYAFVGIVIDWIHKGMKED